MVGDCNVAETTALKLQRLSLMQLNMQLNGPLIDAAGGSVCSCPFDWDAQPPDELLQRRFDLVIGADLVYSFAAVEPFATALQSVLLPQQSQQGPPSTEALEALAPSMLYAHFPRFPNLDQAMATALAAQGLEIRELPLPPRKGAVGRIPEDALTRVQLLEIRRSVTGTPAVSDTVS